MFDLVAQAPEAQPILEAARGPLGGKHPQQFVREANEAELFSNCIGQILCCTQTLAAWAIIRPHLPGSVVIAGYSVGELAAWGCAGLLEPAEVLRLSVTRAEAMDAVGGNDSGLAAVIGLSQGRLEALCRPHGAHIAIINGKDFFIIGGKKEALKIVRDEATKAGATEAILLRVAVAAHTPLLAEASRRFADALAGSHIADRLPDQVRLLSGVDGNAVFDVLDGAHKLAAQIGNTLQWAACLESCRAAGADTLLELGPGCALASMARRIVPEGRIRSVDDFRTPAGVLAWINRQAS